MQSWRIRLSLNTVTISQLDHLPLHSVGAVCLRAAMRVHPLIEHSAVERYSKSDAIAMATAILRNGDNAEQLYPYAENAYLHAASAAARYRVSGNEKLRQVSIVGAIIHSMLDCVADLDHDHLSSLSSAMLAIRFCGKLEIKEVEIAVAQDLEYLNSDAVKGVARNEILASFGALWRDVSPNWF